MESQDTLKKKILVVDDEVKICKMLKTFLESEGFETVTAGDGQMALQKYEEEKPDLVITDLLLPKVHGFEICHRIKEKSTTPVILMTAVYTQTKYKIEGKGHGADDYIIKPFNPEELLSKVKKLLEGAGDGSSAGK